MPSTFHSPNNWQCPCCHQQHGSTTNKQLTFVRGSCQHDVCTKCITQFANCQNHKKKSPQKNSKKRKRGGRGSSGTGGDGMEVEITCPIELCGFGKFVVDMAKLGQVAAEGVIDLSNESEKDRLPEPPTSSASKEENKELKSPLAKRRNNFNKATASSSGGKDTRSCEARSLKNESIPKNDRPTQTTQEFSNCVASLVSPKPATRNGDLKPLFEKGDRVYSAWWDPNKKVKPKGDSSWYSGQIKGYSQGETKTCQKYGPTRLYNVRFDDGDKLDNVDDFFVFSKEDYELTTGFAEAKREWVGVKNERDAESKDRWASDVGWYSVVLDGKKQLFSKLEDAMTAHDVHVVRAKAMKTEECDLNMPEKYPWVFAKSFTKDKPKQEPSVKREPTQGAFNNIEPKQGTIVNNSSKEDNTSVKKESKQGSYITKEPKDSTSAKDESKDESDDDSRFSIEVIATAPSTIKPVPHTIKSTPPQSKKVRLEDPSKDKFWEITADPIDFSKAAFMKQPLFHLNSGIDDSDRKANHWFGPFLREGIATPGFASVPIDIALQVPHQSYADIRDMIHEEWNLRYGYEKSRRGACQVAMWLKDAVVGSFVLMRHEFPNCPYCPQRLKENGTYIGPVYVIGAITKKILPGSEEERQIQQNKMREFPAGTCNDHTFCLVEWRKMGFKSNLKESTKRYINSVCQPTLNRMCQNLSKKYSSGATGESVRLDFWENASVPISSADFPDVSDNPLWG